LRHRAHRDPAVTARSETDPAGLAARDAAGTTTANRRFARGRLWRDHARPRAHYRLARRLAHGHDAHVRRHRRPVRVWQPTGDGAVSWWFSPGFPSTSRADRHAPADGRPVAAVVHHPARRDIFRTDDEFCPAWRMD